MRLALKEIRRDFRGEQFNFDEKIADMVCALCNGITLPPLLVCYDSETYWLADGFNRMAAMLSLGWEEAEVEVVPGTLAEMQADFDRMIREKRGNW